VNINNSVKVMWLYCVLLQDLMLIEGKTNNWYNWCGVLIVLISNNYSSAWQSEDGILTIWFTWQWMLRCLATSRNCDVMWTSCLLGRAASLACCSNHPLQQSQQQ